MKDKNGSKYVPIYLDWLEVTQDLTAEEKGNLIDCLIIRDIGNDTGILNLSGCGAKGFDVFMKLKDKIDRFRELENGRPSGEFHWNWKGGKTPANQRERSSKEYSEWRKTVFARDNFTCQICGQVGGGLNAHHIKRWSTNVDERYNPDNGITLCKKCHAELHRKGAK